MMRRVAFLIVPIVGWFAASAALAYDGLVEKKVFEMPSYATVGGATIKQVRVGYETIGSLNAAGDNAILIPHFFSANSHFAGRYKTEDTAPGYWDAIVGPGKPLDTDKYFLVSVDTLVNINTKDGTTVTTGPASIDPDTGKPYGLSFPVVEMRDSVNVQKALLDSLGVKKLHAVMGVSGGGIQAFEWGAAYPDMVERIIPVSATPQLDGFAIARVENWAEAIKLDPKWNHGDYYGKDEPMDGLTMAFMLLNIDARALLWADETYGRKWADNDKDPGQSIDDAFAIVKWNEDAARARAKVSDANNFIYLARANALFSVGGKPTLAEGLKLIKAKVLLLPARHDFLLFPTYSSQARDMLAAQGNTVEYVELVGPLGHLDGIAGIAQASDTITKFLSE